MGSPTDGDNATLQAKRIEQAVADGHLSASAAENLNRWLTEPQYQKYAARLSGLIDAEEFAQLDTLFWEVIPFGTGGRRGLMSDFGSATINERTIAESAHGLAVYFKQQGGDSPGRAVVACDTRFRSLEFAKLSACTLTAHGMKVFYFDSFRSTPELSFAVRHLNCDLGVMITASHNPPSDNGFKAYWSSGGQVLPPHDTGIIECVYTAGEIPTVDFDEAVAGGRIEIVGEEIDRAYIDVVLAMSLTDSRNMAAIFSPLHGVGETSIGRALSETGFSRVEVFEPNRAADGNFTNVPDHLPNPERPEVFAPMIARAKETGTGLILASDPDADRLGVAVKGQGGDFVHLTGNRIGTLLADYILRKRTAAGTLSPDHFVVETLVTTPLIYQIARSHHVRVIDDLLVGFKYIGQTIDDQGPENFVFGAEESLGYLAGSYCRDKDASLAALYMMELASELAEEGKTLLDRLDELYQEHGYFTEGQRSEVRKGSQGKAQIDRLMQILRDEPPTELSGVVLTQVRDYSQHEVRRLPENTKTEDLPQPDGNLLFFDSAEGEFRFSLAVRPSGTEPKIKFYFFAHAGCADRSSLDELKEQTERRFHSAQDALSKWVREVLDAL